jgi:hypothetical protein
VPWCLQITANFPTRTNYIGVSCLDRQQGSCSVHFPCWCGVRLQSYIRPTGATLCRLLALVKYARRRLISRQGCLFRRPRGLPGLCLPRSDHCATTGNEQCNLHAADSFSNNSVSCWRLPEAHLRQSASRNESTSGFVPTWPSSCRCRRRHRRQPVIRVIRALVSQQRPDLASHLVRERDGGDVMGPPLR